MQIRKLRFCAFRNLEEATLEFDSRLNVFVGLNGQGKTNLIEAIHLASTLKTFKSGITNSDLVAWGQNSALLQADFEQDGPLPVEVIITNQGKKARVGGKVMKDAAELGKSLATVTFIPDDLQLVQGSPQRRRRALDRFCFGLNPRYAHVYRRYAHALGHRNQLLKQPHSNPEALAAFDETLVLTGVELVRIRHSAASLCADVFRSFCLVGDAFDAQMQYHAQVFSEEDIHQAPVDWMHEFFRQRLAQKRNEEQRRRTSLIGPHLDDILFDFAGRSARRLVSQGQARAMVLALKMAEVEIIEQQRQCPPILMLDDVISELDREKASNLLKHVQSLGAQTFITTTELTPLLSSMTGRCYQLDRGQVRAEFSLATPQEPS